MGTIYHGSCPLEEEAFQAPAIHRLTIRSTEPPRAVAVRAPDSLPMPRPVHAAVGDFHRYAVDPLPAER